MINQPENPNDCPNVNPNPNPDPIPDPNPGFAANQPPITAVPPTVPPAASGGKHRKKKEKKPRTPWQKVRRVLLIILCVLLALILALGVTFFVLYKRGEKNLLGYRVNVTPPTEIGDLDMVDDDGSKIVYRGKTYSYNTNSVNLLVIGVDKAELLTDAGVGQNGQADVLLLVNFDTKTGAVRALPISRETMIDIRLYSESGYAKMERLQICLAYAYGNTGKESCENTCEAVRTLLYNIPIEYYVATDLNGLVKMTDAVGGVTLSPVESISNSKFTVSKGKKVTLKGEIADFYVHYRNTDLKANDRRMKRQRQFLEAFANKAGNQIMDNPTRLTTLYNKLKPYMISNLSLDEITYLSTKCLTVNVGSSVTYHEIAGKLSKNKSTGYTEFAADETSLWESVLATCYIQENS